MFPAVVLLAAAAADPAYSTFDQAYSALRAREYDTAIALFRSGLVVSPGRNDVRKDLAYTLLKVGEPAAARDHFAEVARRAPSDHHAALEYAFLAYETGQQREARLVFDRVRKTADAAQRATGEQAFRNVDGPLAEGIARWQRALQREPDNFSAHQELASLAEQRNDWALAAKHLEHAWRLKPAERQTLLDLGRANWELGRSEQSMAALIAASRGPQPRVAEAARAVLPSRYPYIYEFKLALSLDPGNVGLRRELAYLLLEMDSKPEAEAEFEAIVREQPEDLLSHAQLGFLKLARRDRDAALPLLQKVLDANAEDELSDRVRAALELPKQLRKRPDAPRRDLIDEARRMAEKCFDAGYLKDALRYLTIAHEHDPVDFGVILKLGQTQNLLKNDREALQWFSLARKSPDPAVSHEANRAYRGLRPQFQKVRISFWAFPFYSSRWSDAFSYAQFKTELNLPSSPIRPYMSIRFIGDLRGAVHDPFPQYLSETAVIPGVGLATRNFKGLFAWAEAGLAISYLRRGDGSARSRPDYRGGLSYSFTRGRHLYLDHHDDLVYVSRFGNTALLYTQNKFGRALADDLRIYWNVNLTLDSKRQYWANTAETGPGVKWRLFSVDLVRGAHLVNLGNPRRPNYTDVRAGVWYAFSR
jgi:predicted Zn-dependent protease